MINFLTNNWGTLVVCLVVIAIVFAIVRSMVIKKKQGKSITCDCGGCDGCGSAAGCGASFPDSLTDALPMDDIKSNG